MCGITGYWAGGDAFRGAVADEILTHMSNAIVHRGPDASGQWSDPKSGIALAHRRLSIIDLSDAGSQPMHSASGRYVIIYNGEIYNFEDLREELEQAGSAPIWRGHSDTEVLLAAIEAWGLEQALQKAFGMFALALWDCKNHTLSIARDRLGEKPLYYGLAKGNLIFASELKSFIQFPAFEPQINQRAVSTYLQLSYIPSPLSIYEGIFKLEPGTIAVYSNPTVAPEITTFWKFSKHTQTPRRDVSDISFEAASDELEEKLSGVIGSQMLSDVPLGSFLSGGIDSSLVTALMQKNSDRKINTFSIGFTNAQFNESDHAKQVADHIGTNHTQFIVTERDALDLVPSLPQIYDEPFADPSQLPTILLSRLARENVTVALTGDGGDEAFGGYNRHIFGPGLWNKISKTPKFAKSIMAKTAKSSQSFLSKNNNYLAGVVAKFGLPVTTVNKLTKFASMVQTSKSFEDFYQKTVSTWPSQYDLVEEAPLKVVFNAFKFDNLGDSASLMMALDAMTYLPNDILVKVDRASMSASLETRAPLIDARIFEYAWSLPENYLIEGKSGKRILKKILLRHVSQNVIERPKQGFAIPVDEWLRGELREWAEVGIKQFCENGVRNKHSSIINQMWADHKTSRQNNGYALWSVLMLNSWMEQNRFMEKHIFDSSLELRQL